MLASLFPTFFCAYFETCLGRDMESGYGLSQKIFSFDRFRFRDVSFGKQDDSTVLHCAVYAQFQLIMSHDTWVVVNSR